MNTLSGKTVVIVGGSSGMGLGAAQVAAMSGAHVVITSSTASKLEAALATLHPTEGTVKAEVIDVLSETSARECFARIASLDHLFITASPGSTGKFLDQSVEAAKSYMEGKYWSTYRVTYHAIPYMPEESSITFLSGGLAIRPSPGTTVVSSAFAAVETLAKALAVELSPRRFNTIRPGTIATDLWSFKSEADRRKFYEKEAASVPVQRMGQPTDIGHAAVFLMTNSFVTGTVLEVNGGWHLI